MLRKFDSGGPLRTLVETACLRNGTPFHPGIVNDIGHIAAPLHLSVENPSLGCLFFSIWCLRV